MKIVNLNEDLLRVGWVLSRLPARVDPSVPGLGATFFLKATYRMHPDGPVIPWPEGPDHPTGDVMIQDNPALGPAYASDFVPWKPVADFAVAGTAHPPHGRHVKSFVASVRVGKKQKDLLVSGRREWKGSLLGDRPGAPGAAGPVLLSYANAWGGADDELNPLGRGRDEDVLHEVDFPASPVEGRHSRVHPAGLGPIPATWAQRSEKAGTYDHAWLRERWPWLPEDFDFSYFNAVPPSQWMDGYFSGDEEIVFQHLHAQHPTYRTRLPGQRARCFCTHTIGSKQEFSEVPLTLDTLWADMDAEKLVLVWRGRTPTATIKLPDIPELLVLLEPLGSPRGTAGEYRKKFLQGTAQEVEPDPQPMPDPAAVQAELAAAMSEVEAGMAAMKKEMLAREAEAKAQLGEHMDLARKSSPDLPKELRPSPGKMEDPFQETLEFLRNQKLEPTYLQHAEKQAALAKEGMAGLAAYDQKGAQIEAAVLAVFPDSMKRLPPPKDAPPDPEAARRGDFQGMDLSGHDFSGLDLSRANFRRCILARANFSGANLWGADLSEADLSGADVSGANFESAHLADADLHKAKTAGANWKAATLDGASLRGLSLAGADFSGASAARADFSGSDLQGANFSSARAAWAAFGGASLGKAEFRGADLSNADFAASQAEGVCLEGANLAGARVTRGANFRGADIRRADAPGSIWSGAILDRANFQQAKLRRGQFCETSLAEANLDRCDLAEASFEDARLRGAALTRANLLRALLDRADLSDAKMDGANLYDASFWEARLDRATWNKANIKRTSLAL